MHKLSYDTLLYNLKSDEIFVFKTNGGFAERRNRVCLFIPFIFPTGFHITRLGMAN